MRTLPLSAGEQAHDDAQESAFARATEPQQHMHFAACHGQVHAIERLFFTKTFTETADFNTRHAI